MAFGIEARAELTQVLFFKFRRNDVELQHYSGKVSVNAHVLEGVRGEIASKLVPYASAYIQNLPEL
jgi:hypothetical protein